MAASDARVLQPFDCAPRAWAQPAPPPPAAAARRIAAAARAAAAAVGNGCAPRAQQSADGSAARAPSDPIIRQLFRRERALRRSGSAHPRCIRDFAARLRRASGAFLARARNVCWNVSLGAAGTFLERFSDVAGRFWTARLLSAYAMPSRFQGAVQGRAGCVSGPRAERFWNVSANVFGTFLERF